MTDVSEISTGVDAGKPAFMPVGILETKCNASSAKVRANVAENLKRDLPRLHRMLDYGKSKGNAPLAIVAGGPSLNQTMAELRGFENIMVCGTAHDHAVAAGITPRYAAVCDADPSVADFMSDPDFRCTYFVASMCDPSVFDALDGYNVVMWNCFQGDTDMFGGEPSILGGSTVALRGINIAVMLGWRNLHFFGLVSSFEGREHAYAGKEETEPRIQVRAGEREFTSTPGWLAQATHFGEMCRSMSQFFTPTVHGDSLISAMMKPQMMEPTA